VAVKNGQPLFGPDLIGYFLPLFSFSIHLHSRLGGMGGEGQRPTQVRAWPELTRSRAAGLFSRRAAVFPAAQIARNDLPVMSRRQDRGNSSCGALKITRIVKGWANECAQ
jgi:hypothetical protein